MRYDKPALSVVEQASRLRQRGLHFTDEARVQHYLTHIGYYRLSAYWLPFEQAAGNGLPRNHQFQPGTTFEQVLSLYIFDRQLRLLVIEAIERIETAIRTHWAHALAMRHGPHAHLNASLFKSPWQHASDIARIAGELQDSSETFVAHYRRQYDEPYLPPIWAVVETLSLGALSRWFKATKDNDAKREVAKGLGMPTVEVLEQVLHALTPVRNVCAHHGRLWNRRFTLQLPHIKRLNGQMVIERISATRKQTLSCDQCGLPVEHEHASVQEQPTRQIYNYLLVMAHLMLRINPGSSWRLRLVQHIQSVNTDQQRAMGFPAGWKQIAIWHESLRASQAEQWTEEVTLKGRIPEVDQADHSFELELRDGTKLKAPLLDLHLKTVLDAAVGYRDGTLVAIKGVIQRDRADRRKGFESVEHITPLDPLDIETRLEELAQLRDGWLDGKGRAPERAALLRLAQAFDEHYAPDLLLPYLYPTAEGGVQAEWTFGAWEVSLEIALPAMAAQYQALHLNSGESCELDLILAGDDGAGWTALNAALKAVQEGQA